MIYVIFFKRHTKSFLVRLPPSTGMGSMDPSKKNGVAEDADEITALLHVIGLSDTLEEMEKAIETLRANAVYRAHKRFKQYIETRWLSCKEVSFIFLCLCFISRYVPVTVSNCFQLCFIIEQFSITCRLSCPTS